MKNIKKFFSAAVIASAVFMYIPTLSAAAFSSGIDDRAGLYSQSQIERLEERQADVAELTGWNIAVVTTDIGLGVDGLRAMNYAEDYYDDTFGSTSSSVVYLIDLDYRYFSMDGNVLDYFNTSRFDKMKDACEAKYKAYDDVGNLETFYDYLERYYNEGTVARDSNIGPKGAGYDPGKSQKDYNFGLAFIVGIIPAAIAVAVVVSRYKYHHAAPPNCYLNGNSINIYNRRDTFVREYTTRTRISDSSSGGGGGGGSHGGGSHGGSSHGGGGSGGRR